MKIIAIKKKKRLHEHREQAALFKWAGYMQGQYPELGMMFAIPNGGARDPVTGAILKQEGVKAGVPDIFLAVPRGKYHGMFIEMKVKNDHKTGKPTEKQKWWINNLRRQGYKVEICFTWDQARLIILDYLSLPQLTA